MRFEIAADTDRGIVKETNQDSLLVKCFSTCKGDMAFAVLCDGMGGLSKGELASATVSEHLTDGVTSSCLSFAIVEPGY